MSHEIDLKNSGVRTDLAIELTTNQSQIEEDGVKITDIILDENEAKKINKKEGTYITIEFADITDYENRNKVKTIFIKELKKMLKKLNINNRTWKWKINPRLSRTTYNI